MEANNNNGKITVGILIMFVVAISIVGVTFAYFTAQFTPNPNPESVRVVAGELIANYTRGSSLTINNVVPGWINDGLHYYDVDVAAADGGHIYASKATYAYTQLANTKATVTNGIASPISFTVSNNKNSAAEINYIIRLNVKKNGIYDAWSGISTDSTILTTEEAESLTAANKASSSATALKLRNNKDVYDEDRNNLYVTIYKGTFDVTKSVDDNYGDGNTIVAGPYIVADTGIQQVVSTEPIEIEKDGEEHKYFVIFRYSNMNDKNQLAQATQLNYEVNIIGIQPDNDATYTYNKAIEDGSITIDDMVVRAESDTVSITTESEVGEDENGDEVNYSFEIGTISTTDTAETKVTAAKTAKLAKFKEEHGSKTVWYDADNNIVFFALEDEIKDAGNSTNDPAPIYCTTGEAAIAGNSCWNSTAE